MNEREFCYWLQGLLELSDVKTLNETQVVMIREHLKLVFEKVTFATFEPISSSDWANMPMGTGIQIMPPGTTCAIGTHDGVPDYPIPGSC